jgi:hypothetical protein
MHASEVRQQLDAEIAGDWSRTNAHGVDLKKCLVEPRKVNCRNTFPLLRGGQPLPLWIVLEEKPDEKEGYLIVFDEETRKFGLADWDGDTPVFWGFHGSFLATLEGM